jgi:uroporphyrinogen-III synthase
MLPLQNKRILITRTRHQASTLAVQLEALGAITIAIPTIEIIPPKTYAPLDAALAQLDQYNWLIFTSANAVEVFNLRLTLRQNQVHRTQRNLPRVAVIGPATAKAVQGIGLTIDLIPPQYIAESLAEALTPYAANSRMLLIRAEQARDILPETLVAAGAAVTIADAYRSQMPPDSIPAFQQLFSTPVSYPNAITFTSASTARNLIELLQAAELKLPTEIVLASIGPITSQALHDLGHTPTIEASEPTIPALVQSLLTHLSQTS